MHLEALVSTTEDFTIESKHDYDWHDDINVLYHVKNHRFHKTKQLAGFVYGLQEIRNPWRQALNASKFFAPLAIISKSNFHISIRKNLLQNLEFDGEYYVALILSQDEDSVTCARIGLAMIERSIFDGCETQQKLIHLV